MKIKKDGFVCRVAYGGKEIPELVSVCKLFWLFVGYVVFTLTATIILYPIGFLFGNKCTLIQDTFLNEEHDEPFVKFEKWPTVAGYRILPVYLIPLAVV